MKRVTGSKSRQHQGCGGESPRRPISLNTGGFTFLCSLNPFVKRPLLALNRDGWSIENKSHYVRDVTYDEDRSQVRTKNGPRVMASVRNIAIGLLRMCGFKGIPTGNRHCANTRVLHKNRLPYPLRARQTGD